MRTLLFLVTICLCVGPPAIASPTVRYTSVYGWEVDVISPWYEGPMTAGIYKLLIDGSAADSFCIDPPEEAPRFLQPYSIINLADGPDPVVGPMGVQKAEVVRKLWAMAYSPSMTMDQAAGLQIAIWDTVVDLDYDVCNGSFQIDGYEYGAQTLLSNVQSYAGPLADLMVLTSPDYQDFVTPVVPDPPAVPVPGALWLVCAGASLVARRRLGEKR